MIERNFHDSGFDGSIAGLGDGLADPGMAERERELNRIEWGTLCARFTAARELRRVFQNRRETLSASFASFTVQGASCPDDNQRIVNRDASADGKQFGSEKQGAANGAYRQNRQFADLGDREFG